jgi:uncharacterized DUF497 family protein
MQAVDGVILRRSPAIDSCVYHIYTTPVNDDIYNRLARSEGFNWDEGNAPKVQARHGVEPGECEQAFLSEPLLVAADPAHSQHEERWRALGATVGGRSLYLNFTLRGSLIRVLAARDMNRKERHTYDQAKARAQEDPDVHIRGG